MTAEKPANRLVHETSPYLLQHARNPVDWRPWGDAAFDEAKERGVPVFLSVGYSSCHWCHVMERESFEDEEVAGVLNRHFVSVKVDREERPDVDHIYMSACVALTGRGGWPLTAFLTADRKPFYAGSYFPKRDTRGATGLLTLLDTVTTLWETERDSLLASADRITGRIRERPAPGFAAELTPDLPATAAAALVEEYDRQWGGFGGAPKFPSPHTLMFLMRSDPDASSDAWKAALGTLDAMAAGGIRDHVGGGFCRYSTDERWLVPHFEKMTYDNALLCMAYTEAYQKTGREAHAAVAREILRYVSREMTDPATGGFYTAQDADSDGVEGGYYLWTPAQVSDTLGPGPAGRFCAHYDIRPGGHLGGGSIPNRVGVPYDGTDMSAELEILYLARLERVRPMRDEKILLTDTGLMICALAKAGAALRDETYGKAAARAAQFVLRNLRAGEEGRFFAVWKDGLAGKPATLDGYAYFVWGLLELYMAQHRTMWLEKAIEVNDAMLALFEGENGGLYYTGADMSDLPVRGVNAYDGAVPSGHSVAAHNLLRLSRLTGREEYERRARALIDSLPVARASSGFSWMLAAVRYLQDGGTDIVLADGEDMDDMLEALEGFHPFLTVTLVPEGDAELVKLAPYLKPMKPIDGRATAYICRHGGCGLPVTDADELSSLLDARGEVLLR